MPAPFSAARLFPKASDRPFSGRLAPRDVLSFTRSSPVGIPTGQKSWHFRQSAHMASVRPDSATDTVMAVISVPIPPG